MSQQLPDIQTQDIDHLGIIAGIVDEIGIVEKIDTLIGIHPLEKVSAGQVVKAMILNCLGFVTAPLYLFHHFFIGKATEHLLGPGVLPEHLNDDRLGRVLDQLHAVGLSRVFLEIALAAAKRFGISSKRMHLDGTSFHVHGEYKESSKETKIDSSLTTIQSVETTNATLNDVTPLTETTYQLVPKKSDNQAETEDFQAIHITYGYSRDHRPDLKQYLMNIMSSSDGEVPLFLHIGDGNEAEKSRFPKLIKEFKSQWTFQDIEVFVADSALYSESNIKTLGDLPWISRVPLTLKAAKQLVETLSASEFIPSQIPGYTVAEIKSNYGEVEQRWLVVESQERRKTDLKQLSKQLDKQQKTQQSALQKLCHQELNCEEDARAAAQGLATKMKYHLLENIEVVETAHYHKSGRPSIEQQPSHLSYHVQANLVRNRVAITTAENQAGRFILATNLIDIEQWSPTNVLQEYKQQSGSERGFKFLKDPIFFASSVFVKSAKRVAALAMIMGLCLLVYTIGQRQLRHNLAAAEETIPNQLGKPTKTPTLRWVFQCFQAVHIVLVSGTRLVTNLTIERKFLLQFLGSACQKYYLLC